MSGIRTHMSGRFRRSVAAFLLLLLFIAPCSLLTAQQARYERRGNGAPSNPCTVGKTAAETYVDSATGKHYNCKSSDGNPTTSGIWVEATTAGGSGIPGIKLSSDYADLNAALTAISSTPTILIVHGNFALGSGSVTIPSTLFVQFIDGKITGTGSLAINSSLAMNFTNPTQIFDSTVVVTPNSQIELLPEWWGVVGDWNGSTGTDNATAWARVTAAAARAKTSRVVLQSKSYLGRVVVPATSGAEWQSFVIEGPMHPAFQQGTVNGGHTPTTHGAILVSHGSGGAVVSAAGSYIGSITLKNLTLQTYDNPNESGFDGTLVEQAIIDTVAVYAGAVYTSAVSQPTHTTASGIIFPPNGNSSESIGRDLLVQGYYNGIIWNEHAYIEYAQIAACENAILLPGAGHALYGGRILIDNCPYGLTFTGSSTALILNELAVERGVNAGFPAWQIAIAEINDPSNLAYGSLNYLISQASNGYQDILKIGGVHLVADDILHKAPNISVVGTQFNKTSDTTLAAIPGLASTHPLDAGHTYSIHLVLFLTSGAGGTAVDFNGGTATATSFIALGQHADAGGANVTSTNRGTALTSTFNNGKPDGGAMWIDATITVKATGSFIPRFAQFTSNGTQSSVLVGSYMSVTKIN